MSGLVGCADHASEPLHMHLGTLGGGMRSVGMHSGGMHSGACIEAAPGDPEWGHGSLSPIETSRWYNGSW